VKVLSLFDGISCARIALEKLGYKNVEYYASEINQDAINVSKSNWVDITQLGDIRNITGNESYLQNIDLVIFGSPCQDLSIAMRNRKGLQGCKSSLFHEAIRLLRMLQPKYFLMENVASMKQDDKDFISKEIGVEPILINSQLVSGQLRKRLYWTNIKNVNQPTDKNIQLKDIITSGYVERPKSVCITARGEGIGLKDKNKIFKRYKNSGFLTIVFETQDYSPENIRVFNQIELERLQTLPEGYTKILPRNRAIQVIGNAFTTDVIIHILKNMEAT